MPMTLEQLTADVRGAFDKHTDGMTAGEKQQVANTLFDWFAGGQRRPPYARKPVVSALTHTHEAAMKELDNTETLLAERGKTHGDFRDHAAVTQNLKTTFYNTADKKLLRATQREAVDMILHKLGRIAAGDPNFKDHWDDIAGYARLVSQDLERGS